MGSPKSRKSVVTYSTLLLHLDDDTRGAIRLDEAMKLARRFNSRLIGLSCHRPAPWIGVAGSEFMGADPLTTELQLAAHAASSREAAFLRQCDVAGLASFEVATSDDEPARAIGERGFCADLILLGQADPADAGHARQRDIVDRVMEQTAAPVLVLPYAGRFATLGETVLIAWSHSREAARAVADAMPLLKQAHAVHLVNFDPSVGESGEPDGPALLAFEATGAYRLLLPAMSEDPGELQRFYAETVEPLVAYDDQYETDLVQTLETFLDADGNVAGTAQRLFTHRHTVRYRLERVRDLTGLDVSSTDGRERLGLGLKAMRVLGIASPQGPATEAGAGGGRVRREQKDR